MLGYGWIKRGEGHEVLSNTGRRRVNINGAIDFERFEPVVRFDDSINADSTIALFEQLEQFHAATTYIYVICDNARCYHSRAVQAYLEGSRINLVSLPPYAPNLLSVKGCGSSSRKWSYTTDTTNRLIQSERLVIHSREACPEFFSNPQ